MRHILGNEGQAALQELLATPDALLAFDFDGTLAPIVADPRMARTALPVSRAMRSLATRWPVAVVTGRAVSDVRERLGFDAWAIIGSHGAEDPFSTSADAVDPAALDVVRQALDSDLSLALDQTGVLVEDKGYSMALHYRLARDRDAAHAAALAFVQALGPAIETFEGKMVINIVVPGSPNKGDALKRLALHSGASAVLFVGDDTNDEPAFVSAAPHWVTVKVGRDAHSAARFFLDTSAEMAVLLDLCVKLGPRTAGA